MRALMGALPAPARSRPWTASICWRSRPIAARAHGIGYMPEDRRLVPEFARRGKHPAAGLDHRGRGREDRLTGSFRSCPRSRTSGARRALELSGGQQKMVALARALMAGRRLLLLDEPFEGLAPALARRLGEVLSNLKGEGVSVLMSESNELHVIDLLDRTFRIERGSVVAG